MRISLILVILISICYMNTTLTKPYSQLYKELQEYYARKNHYNTIALKSKTSIQQLVPDRTAEAFSSLFIRLWYWPVSRLKTCFGLNSITNAYAASMAIYIGLDIACVCYPDVYRAQILAVVATSISFLANRFIGSFIYEKIDSKQRGFLSFERTKELSNSLKQTLDAADKALLCAYIHTILKTIEPQAFCFSQKLSDTFSYIIKVTTQVFNSEPVNVMLFFTQLFLLLRSTQMLSASISFKLLGIQPSHGLSCCSWVIKLTSFTLMQTSLEFSKAILYKIQCKAIRALDKYAGGAINYVLVDSRLNQAESYLEQLVQAYNSAQQNFITQYG